MGFLRREELPGPKGFNVLQRGRGRFQQEISEFVREIFVPSSVFVGALGMNKNVPVTLLSALCCLDTT